MSTFSLQMSNAWSKNVILLHQGFLEAFQIFKCQYRRNNIYIKLFSFFLEIGFFENRFCYGLCVCVANSIHHMHQHLLNQCTFFMLVPYNIHYFVFWPSVVMKVYVHLSTTTFVITSWSYGDAVCGFICCLNNPI